MVNLPIGVGSPCVSWYSSVTSEFINYGLIPVEYQPLSLYEDAEPNILVTINGTPVRYKKDWLFLLKQESNTITAAIALSSILSLSLFAGDTVRIEYFSTT
jgi:hypothetical protein